jgi:hypothetical protein
MSSAHARPCAEEPAKRAPGEQRAAAAEPQLELERCVEGEPALSAEAGLTAAAARAGGGYADDELAAGFVSKQTPLDQRKAGK